jgi:catechol 2,3-dioxygenase-like lactoylglutathione lyase family enzyme
MLGATRTSAVAGRLGPACSVNPVTAQLNHTIVRVRNKQESATFLAEILGLPAPTPFGPFLVVQTANEVSLDFADDQGPPTPQHYAFLVSEPEFDEIFGRIRERGLPYWADPSKRRPGEFNTNDGGRGLYWEDPSGHFLEIITRPYGSGS